MMTAYPIFYRMNHTDNRLALSSAALCRVDDFTMSITPPKAGSISLTIHIDGCEPSVFVLRAENDDLMKLKTWMEDVVRDEHAEVELSSGQRLAYCVTDVPESSVEPTIRFLDELFPSPIGILTLTPAEGQAIECVVKVKHFLNALYLHLLTGGCANSIESGYGRCFPKQWYAYSPTPNLAYEKIRKGLYHYNQLRSPLIEWYLCESCSYEEARPRFKWIPDTPVVIRMQADWDIPILFWMGWRECAGEVDYIEIEPYHFDLSDIEDIERWGEAYRKMSIPLPGIADDEDVPGREVTKERKDWQIQGYRLAQQVRCRLPLNVPLMYELTYEIAYDTPLWNKDIGHIIFDPRLLEKQTDERKG